MFELKKKDHTFRVILSADNLYMKPINELSAKKVLIKKKDQKLDEINEDLDQKEGFKYSNIK